MSETSEHWIAVARASELPERSTKKFFAVVDGQEEECFLLRFEGRLFAYVNRCCHVPLTLDWVDNRFFTADGGYVQCATHGARYLPDTGECVAGPPLGKSLRPVPIVVHDGVVYARTEEQNQDKRENKSRTGEFYG